MSDNDDTTPAEPMVPTEQIRPDHHEHAKMPHPADDDELARRVQHERDEVGADGPDSV